MGHGSFIFNDDDDDDYCPSTLELIIGSIIVSAMIAGIFLVMYFVP